MRLLTYDSRGKLHVTHDRADDTIPPYAILSHTWGADKEEVTLRDLESGSYQTKAGYQKIKYCGQQAQRDGLQNFWVDTCCIDKANHLELSVAITSMYRWYQQAQVCYVYLADVSSDRSRYESTTEGNETDCPWESSFRQSRWFTRGWTLQELLAPKEVVFYSQEWHCLGNRSNLQELLHSITSIPLSALGGASPFQFPVVERMRWARHRSTRRREDNAYCLLGLFGVGMPIIYGEGDYAFQRLRKRIAEQRGGDGGDGGDGSVDLHSDSFQGLPTFKSLGLCLGSAALIHPNEFVGRTTELATIHEVLRPHSRPHKQQRVVLSGIGGIGKTQLAIAYARQHQESYTSVLWLNATSQQTLHTSIRSVVSSLVTANELARLDNMQQLAHSHVWLSHPQNTDWLLIFDNYDDPAEFDLDYFCPNTSFGSIIVTTRIPDMVGGEHVQIRPLEQLDDGLAILRTRSGRDFLSEDTTARRLVARLGGLPLGLAAAGAFLRNSTLSLQQYLEAYEQHWQVGRRQRLRLQEYQDRTLYTSWLLTYSVLDTEAAQMLRLLAYFDNQELWYELFQAGLLSQSSAQLPACLTSRVDFESAMNTLVDYCLVEAQHTNQSYSIHVCTHDWTLATLNADIDTQFYWYAFDCVAAIIDKTDWEALGEVRYARVSRHAVRLTHHHFSACDQISSGLSEHLENATLIAQMLEQQVQLSAAEQMYTRALAGYEKALGPDHISTLNTVSSIGHLYATQARLKEAEQAYQRALVGKEKALGLNHVSTLDTVNNLGLLYADQDKLEQAEQLYQRALVGYEKALGPNHNSTLSVVNNLGLLYRHQGRLKEAERMYQRVLVRREKALGPTHISTLDIVNNLGLLYAGQDKLEQAEQLYQRALVGYEKALGPNHNSTLSVVNNLGLLYRHQGKLEQAELMYERALAGREKVLGPAHTSTLDTINNLGFLYAGQGKLEQAELMYERALAGREKVLGPAHTSTLDTINNLGLLYAGQGKLEQAELMYERALTGLSRVLGSVHPSTLIVVCNLGTLYYDQGRLENAEQMFARVVASRPSISDSPELSMAAKVLETIRLTIAISKNTNPSKSDYTSSDSGYASFSQPLPYQTSEINSLLAGGGNRAQSSAGDVMCSHEAHTEIASVTSDTEDILSQGSLHRSQTTLAAEDVVARYLVDDALFAAICGDILPALNQRKFVRNLRRLLKKLYIELRPAATSPLEREAIALFQKRVARSRIASQVFKLIQSSQHDEDPVEMQAANIDLEKKAQDVESWIQKSLALEQMSSDNRASNLAGSSKITSGICQDSESQYRSSSDSDTSSHETVAPNILLAKDFLFTGQPFRSFLIQMEAFASSQSNPLIEVLLPIPDKNIRFCRSYRPSIADKLKVLVEGLSGVKWDWWPLLPSQGLLHSDQVRIFWRCHCGTELWQDVSTKRADAYKLLLERQKLRPFPTDNICVDLEPIGSKHGAFHFISSQVFSRFLWRNPSTIGSRPKGATIQDGQESNKNQEVSQTASGHQAGQINSNRPSRQATDDQQSSKSVYPSEHTQNTVRQDEPQLSRGQDDTSQTIRFDIEHIETKSIADDGEFFQELKHTHRRLRSFWRHYLSIWRMSHCDFVKFEMDDQDSIFPRCQGLPKDDDKDYDFKPRPPKDNPPLTRHQFEVALSTCAKACRLPLWHTCRRSSCRKLAMHRIPKKLSAWEIKKVIDEPEYAWGLQVRYRPAFYMVLLYNSLILAGPFAFWVWWQRVVNPLDLQNASVPAVIVLCLLGMFYTLSDVAGPLRHGS